MFGPLARDLVDDVLFIDAFFLIHDWEQYRLTILMRGRTLIIEKIQMKTKLKEKSSVDIAAKGGSQHMLEKLKVLPGESIEEHEARIDRAALKEAGIRVVNGRAMRTKKGAED